MSPPRTPEPDEAPRPARWRRREERRQSERRRMKKHSAALGRVYRDAVLKRGQRARRGKR